MCHLTLISLCWINLTKIESLPILLESFQYGFYIDIKFSDINRYKEILDEIRPLLTELDLLWEYIGGELVLEN